MATMKERVKLALRITNTALDDEIERTIEASREELQRSGVPYEVAYGNNALVELAIETYCKAYIGAPEKQDQFMKSFENMQDSIRKSYREAADV